MLVPTAPCFTELRHGPCSARHEKMIQRWPEPHYNKVFKWSTGTNVEMNHGRPFREGSCLSGGMRLGSVAEWQSTSSGRFDDELISYM